MKSNQQIDTINFNNKEWFLTISRNMSFWHQCLSDEGHSKNLKDFGIDVELHALSVIFDGTNANIYRYNPNYTDFCMAVLRSVDSAKKIGLLKNKYKKYAKSLENSLMVCLNNLNVKNLKRFFEEYQRYTAGLMITATLGRSGNELLIEKLKNLGFSEIELDKITAIITYPEKHTPLFNSQLEILEISKKIKNGKISGREKEKLFKKWLKKYQHIPINFLGDPWDINDTERQLSLISQKNPTDEIKKIKQNHFDKIRIKKLKLKEINNKEVEILAKALADGTYLNEYRKNIFSKISLSERPIFKKIAKLGGSSNWRDCYFLTPLEMISILSGEKITIKDLKNKRSIVVIAIDREGRRIIIGEEAEVLGKKTKLMIGAAGPKKLGGLSNNNTVIKGFSANMGILSGVVRIVLTVKDFNKLLPGEILVTTMTSVDFIPVMQRAGAFVTNEGGITSHASIVAREMNKPCIIGTKIATKVLKDGDLVEVDANKGIVKIIKRAR